MILQERIDVLVQLGDYLQSEDDFLKAVFHRVEYNNTWLTKANSLRAAKVLGTFLQPETLAQWAAKYQVQEPSPSKKVGLILAGNTPLSGVLDIFTIFLSGHHAFIKLSTSDEYTIPHLVKLLVKWNPNCQPYFQVMQRFLKGFDAVVANRTDQNNRYFEAYFGKYPHLLRSNKHTVAVLTGTESDAKLLALGDDVLAYFGLSSNNVSKLYLPKGYDLNHLLEIFHEYKELVLNSKYKNNFDYNYSLFLLNKMEFKANGCLLLIEQTDIPSRIASLHYEYYDNKASLIERLKEQQKEIQGVVSEEKLGDLETLKIGTCHIPSWKHQDQQALMQFLQGLK